MRRYCQLFMLLTMYALSSSVKAQEDESAYTIMLDSISVKGYRYLSPVRSNVNGATVWDLSNMSLLPQFLGSADPMHYAQTLPGIQTNSEYRSGINIEGCDNQHNAILIEGVPIYNVNHLLGFFSTFNTSHFSSMSISKGFDSAASSNRLGGQLEMLHHTEIPDSTCGGVSIGLIASQGTIRLPVDMKTTVTTSFRASYINLLYSQWLKADGQQIKYSFYDANTTLVHRFNHQNALLIDFYSGRDNAAFSEEYYLADMKSKWGNMIGAAHWMHEKGEFSSRTTAYITKYRNEFSLNMQGMSFLLLSSITDVGLKYSSSWKRWNAGGETIWHIIHPQSLKHQGSFNITNGYNPAKHSYETSLFGNYEYPLARQVRLSGGIRGSLFRQGNSSYSALAPSMRLLFDNEKVQLSATYARRHQFLFQTGFSDSGLPTEFWISSSDDFEPQYADELSANISSSFFKRRYRLSFNLFYRRLYNQLGYRGSVLDYVNTVYDIDNSLMHGNGKNYGYSMMFSKCAGHLTGWLSYTYTHARRSFDEAERKTDYAASHERPHEFNAVATYSAAKHWSFGATMVYASGTPFTAAKSLYLLNNNLIIKYGDYNANRLHPYIRIDLSANYKWGHNSEHGINCSLYNVTSRENELFYYLRTREDGSFVYRPVTFVLYTLPSVSYYYKF